MLTNSELARRWYRDVWAAGGEASVAELMAEDVVGFMEGADVHDRDAFLLERARLLTMFPDLAIVADDVIEQDDRVAVRWRVTATHSGPGPDLAPTGRQVAFRGITWLEFKNGRIVRGWDSWNLGGLLQQLSH